ncbi:hypothetical protein [Brachybacterium paraconglomeratum]|uniref:hypothetical protein n=1 Tax=Brachybacterium paraconglomeratum TaxID=173362 RepID=UPI003F7B86DF
MEPSRLRQHLISAGHGKGSTATTQSGLVLADWINRASAQEIVELDDALWARLD